MSQAGVDLLLRGYRAFVAGDLDAIEGMLDPEVEWIGAGEVAAIVTMHEGRVTRVVEYPHLAGALAAAGVDEDAT